MKSGSINISQDPTIAMARGIDETIRMFDDLIGQRRDDPDNFCTCTDLGGPNEHLHANNSRLSGWAIKLRPIEDQDSYCGRTKIRRTIYIALTQRAKPFSH